MNEDQRKKDMEAYDKRRHEQARRLAVEEMEREAKRGKRKPTRSDGSDRLYRDMKDIFKGE